MYNTDMELLIMTDSEGQKILMISYGMKNFDDKRMREFREINARSFDNNGDDIFIANDTDTPVAITLVTDMAMIPARKVVKVNTKGRFTIHV